MKEIPRDNNMQEKFKQQPGLGRHVRATDARHCSDTIMWTPVESNRRACTRPLAKACRFFASIYESKDGGKTWVQVAGDAAAPMQAFKSAMGQMEELNGCMLIVASACVTTHFHPCACAWDLQ